MGRTYDNNSNYYLSNEQSSICRRRSNSFNTTVFN